MIPITSVSPLARRPDYPGPAPFPFAFDHTDGKRYLITTASDLQYLNLPLPKTFPTGCQAVDLSKQTELVTNPASFPMDSPSWTAVRLSPTRVRYDPVPMWVWDISIHDWRRANVLNVDAIRASIDAHNSPLAWQYDVYLPISATMSASAVTDTYYHIPVFDKPFDLYPSQSGAVLIGQCYGCNGSANINGYLALSAGYSPDDVFSTSYAWGRWHYGRGAFEFSGPFNTGHLGTVTTASKLQYDGGSHVNYTGPVAGYTYTRGDYSMRIMPEIYPVINQSFSKTYHLTLDANGVPVGWTVSTPMNATASVAGLSWADTPETLTLQKDSYTDQAIGTWGPESPYVTFTETHSTQTISVSDLELQYFTKVHKGWSTPCHIAMLGPTIGPLPYPYALPLFDATGYIGNIPGGWPSSWEGVSLTVEDYPLVDPAYGGTVTAQRLV